ncbi:MAG: hypothetical protein ACFFDT_40255 [Candidatus Hodarchaeota archaeon]
MAERDKIMAERDKIIEEWVNAKFDAKIVTDLSRKGEYLNISLSLINGKEYPTKLGSAMSVQLGIGDARTLYRALENILSEFDKLKPIKEQKAPPETEENPH